MEHSYNQILGLVKLGACSTRSRGRSPARRRRPPGLPSAAPERAGVHGGILKADQSAPLYEFGRPDGLTYPEIVRLVARRVGRRPLLLPVPFALWTPVARVAEQVLRPPITVNQIDLMQVLDAPSGAAPGLSDLDVEPTSLARAPENALAARQARG